MFLFSILKTSQCKDGLLYHFLHISESTVSARVVVGNEHTWNWVDFPRESSSVASEHNPLEINHFWSFCLIRASRVESREPSTLNSVQPRIIIWTENVLAVNMPAVNKLVAGGGRIYLRNTVERWQGIMWQESCFAIEWFALVPRLILALNIQWQSGFVFGLCFLTVKLWRLQMHILGLYRRDWSYKQRRSSPKNRQASKQEEVPQSRSSTYAFYVRNISSTSKTSTIT